MHAAVITEGRTTDPENFVATIRLVEPLRALSVTRPFTFEIVDTLSYGRVAHADILIFQRACFSADELDAVANTFCALRRAGVAVVWELDDHMFCPQLPALIARSDVDELDDAEYERTQSHRRLFEVVDAVICATSTLSDAIHQLTGVATYVVPVLLDFTHRRWARGPLRRRVGRVTLGWCGGSRVGRDLEMLVPVLHSIFTRYEQVDFAYRGPAKYLRLFEGLPSDRILHQSWVPYDQYPQGLTSVDLALLPLDEHAYNICKSPLKAIDFGAMGVPVVCSDSAVYAPSIDSIRGRAARAADWIALVAHFIETPPSSEARAAMGRAVRERHDAKTGVDHHWDVLQRVCARAVR